MSATQQSLIKHSLHIYYARQLRAIVIKQANHVFFPDFKIKLENGSELK